jgi:predicted acyl esterase
MGNRVKKSIGPSETMMNEGYIIVYQDVRGRWMSDGLYDNNMRFIPNKKGKPIDEASDTYDTIDWLVKIAANNNGNVGVWGISYPVFTYLFVVKQPSCVESFRLRLVSVISF